MSIKKLRKASIGKPNPKTGDMDEYKEADVWYVVLCGEKMDYQHGETCVESSMHTCE